MGTPLDVACALHGISQTDSQIDYMENTFSIVLKLRGSRERVFFLL